MATRVVSLVPSITEAIAATRPEALVGATDWCTHPADLDARGVTRVRGTKNPDLAAIRALRPDVVVCNQEENRELDVRRLRESGIRVWVTRTATVPEAVASLESLVDALGWERPTWLGEVRERWCGPLPEVTRTVAMPIWRDPWMVVGGDTFTSDLLRRLGWANAYADTPRYPAVELADLDGCGADVVLLPDEPYVFTADDGPEAFTLTPTELVSGRHLTWYGPSLLEIPPSRPSHPPDRVEHRRAPDSAATTEQHCLVKTWAGDLVPPGQRRAPAVISAILVVATLGLAAVGATPMPDVALSRPLWLLLAAIANAMAAVVLVGQYRAGASARLVPLTWGFSWSAITAVGLLLVLPDVFRADSAIGDPARAPWLYSLHHLGLPVIAVLALLPWSARTADRWAGPGRTRRLVIGHVVVAASAAALIAVVVAEPVRLPPVEDVVGDNPAGVAAMTWSVAIIGLALLVLAVWASVVRRRVHGAESWGLVAIVSTVGDALLSAVAQNDYSLAWYGARAVGLVGVVALLGALLHEVDQWQTRTRQYATLLESQNADLLEAQGLRDHLAAVVSHEMRSPLAGLQGYLEFLQLQEAIPEAEKQLMLVRSRLLTRRLIMLTEDLLASADTEGLQMLPERVDLSSEVGDCVAAFPEVDIEVRCPSDVEVVADPLRLQQILGNLVSNAKKHGAEPITIVVEVDPDATTRIAVSDAGPGVDPAFVPRLFDRYTRAPDRTTHGSGLGLWVARTLAQRQGGSLRYDAATTAFVLELPAALSAGMRASPWPRTP